MRWFRREKPGVMGVVAEVLLEPPPPEAAPEAIPLKYAGTRYRINTCSPDHWFVEHFEGEHEGQCPVSRRHIRVPAGWHDTLEIYDTLSFHRPFAERPVRFDTKQACKDWIDGKVREWMAREIRSLANEAHRAANPPEEYP